MRIDNVFPRLLSPALVVAFVVGLGLLLDPVASAAPPAGSLGSLTVSPATGTDLESAITFLTSAACPATAGDDAATVFIIGPVGSANPTFPPAKPFPIVLTTKAGFSTTDQFSLQIRDSLNALARVAAESSFGGSGTLQAGEYDITLQCVNALRGTLFGTFTGAIFFTDPAHYNTESAASPSPSVSPTPSPRSSPSPSPAPSPSPRSSPLPTPTATPEGATPTPSPGPSNSADTRTPSGPSAETSSLTSTGTLANTGAPITLLLFGGLILLAAGLVVMLTATRIAWPRHRGRLAGQVGGCAEEVTGVAAGSRADRCTT